ncbi:BQ5605_C003g02483 [Microbotryum silenes-dioicae]|uniref:BQ5605_C003g02483 protein n=1 Tax=Microbotryum silenes-dioicae TaxID=796604 RepID=A0A2X0M5U0_9BASI|nr:BQ5605_C003g02483 [Microbotryum silenes-dioicae]
MSWLQPTPHVSSGSMLDLVNRPTPVVDSLPEAPPPLPELLAGPAPPPAVRKREVGQLIVVVLRAQHLDETVKSPLCTVELTESPGGVESTRVDPRDPQNPVWDEEFRFVVHAAETTKAPTEPLLVKIRDETSGRAGDDQLVGQGQVSVVDSKNWVRNKDTGTYEFDDWVQLQRDGKFAGEVFLEMTFYPAIYRPNTKSMTGPSTRPASTITAPLPVPTNLSSLQRRPSRLDPSTRLQPGHLATRPMLQRPAGRFDPVPRPSKYAQPEAVQQTDPPQVITFNRPSNATEDATSAMTFSSAPESRPSPTRNNFPPSLVPGSRPPSHSPLGPISGSYAQQPPTLVRQMSSLSIPEQLPSQETASSASRRPLPSPPGASLVAYPQRQSYGAGAACTEVGVLQPPPPAQHPQSSPSLENIGTVVSNYMLQNPQPNTGLQQLMPPYQHAHQVQHHQSHQIIPQPQTHQQPPQQPLQQQQMCPQEYRRTSQQQHQQFRREDLQQYQHMYQPSYPAASDQPNRSQYDPQPPLRVPDQSSTHRNSDAHSPSYLASSPRIDITQSRSSPSPSISPGNFSPEAPPRPPKTPYNAPSPVVSASPAVSPEFVAPPPRHGSLPLGSASTSTSRMSSLELSPNVEAATPKSKDKGKQKAEPVPSPSSPTLSPSIKTLTQSSYLPTSLSASTSSGAGSSAKPSATKSSSVDPVMLADQARSLFRFQQEQEDARLAASLAEEAGAAEDQVRIQKAREDEEVVRKLLEEEEKMRVEEEKRNELMARQWEEREKEEKEERERKDEELAFKLAASRED